MRMESQSPTCPCPGLFFSYYVMPCMFWCVCVLCCVEVEVESASGFPSLAGFSCFGSGIGERRFLFHSHSHLLDLLSTINNRVHSTSNASCVHYTRTVQSQFNPILPGISYTTYPASVRKYGSLYCFCHFVIWQSFLLLLMMVSNLYTVVAGTPVCQVWRREMSAV